MKLPGKQKRTEARIARDIALYEAHMRGNSVRAICDEFGIKSTQTVWGGIQRGKQHVKDRGIDVDERRIEIDQLFKDTLGALAKTVQEQAIEGRIQTIERNDGSSEIRRTKGVDPRTAEALARSADRWAQFLGVTDRANEVNQQIVFNTAAFQGLMGGESVNDQLPPAPPVVDVTPGS